MHRYFRRPHLLTQKPVVRLIPRGIARTRNPITRAAPQLPELGRTARPGPLPAFPMLPVDAHLDYRRTMTPEGVISITYKDLDVGLGQLIWRAELWTPPVTQCRHHPAWGPYHLLELASLGKQASKGRRLRGN